jgi:hypothetical protein
MSAKPCDKCGGLIVFGKDRETGRIIPLSNTTKAYRIIKDNVVMQDPKVLVRHVCVSDVPKEPSPAVDFSEPQSQE